MTYLGPTETRPQAQRLQFFAPQANRIPITRGTTRNALYDVSAPRFQNAARRTEQSLSFVQNAVDKIQAINAKHVTTTDFENASRCSQSH